MHTSVARRPDTPRGLRRLAAGAAAALGCGLAAAQDAAPGTDTTALTTARLEMAAEPVLRLHAAEAGTRVEAVGWAGRDAQAVGIALGSQWERVSTTPWQAAQFESSVTLGLRWRSSLTDRRRVDVAAWRAVAGDTSEPVTTRIEMQFTTPRSAGFAELGAIGMQLNADEKLQLKFRRGKPMFYYRARF